jgi:hypothetical protein
MTGGFVIGGTTLTAHGAIGAGNGATTGASAGADSAATTVGGVTTSRAPDALAYTGANSGTIVLLIAVAALALLVGLALVLQARTRRVDDRIDPSFDPVAALATVAVASASARAQR